MRVHELAKELNLTSKQLLPKIKSLGIEVLNHMANLEDDQVATIRAAYIKPQGPARPPQGRPEGFSPAVRPTQLRQTPTGMPQRPVSPGPARPPQSHAGTQPAQPAAKRPRPQVPASAAAAVAARMKMGRQRPTEEGGSTATTETARPVARPQQSRPGGAAPGQQGPRPPMQRPGQGQRPGMPPSGPSGRVGTRPERPTGERPRPGGTPGMQSGPRRRRDDQPVPAGQLIVPTIEVMKMDDRNKAGSGKGKRGAKTGRYAGKPRNEKVEEIDKLKPGVIVQPKRKMIRGRVVNRPQVPVAPKIVRIVGDTTIGQFAEKTGIALSDLMRSLMVNHGQMLTLNQLLPADLMELLAIEFNTEIEVVPESDEADVEKYLTEDREEKLKARPPVVTVMGHVDHGKTTLLDTVRKANVASGEVGGITQHIGAYLVDTSHGQVCFLDTPGHEAFTSMRARGAKVTDIVVLVVAADDGLMPQTVEAINHAREAEVPIVVAINKIDLPSANINRITNDLMRQGLISEQHGGDTIFCHISAKKNEGIDKLLESILLQAEVMELKANPSRNAIGTIVESRNDPQRGAVATVLVQRGTLNVGDNFVVGQTFGRVKAMFNDKGQPIEKAGPSTPVEILGLEDVPEAGEALLVMADERQARSIAETRASRRRARGLEQRQHVSLEGLKDMVREGKVKELKVILKADVQGSAEAVRQSLERIQHDEIRVRVLHSGVGAITESDITLADASDAIVIGFNIRPDVMASQAAADSGVQIRTYQIIYDLINDVKQAMVGMLEKKFREISRGRAEVRQVFRVSKVGNIAGCFVQSGEIKSTSRARLLRDSAVVYEGKIANLRRFKDDVRSVQAGLDCGIGLENYQDVKEGDEIEVFDLEEIAQHI